VVVRRRCVVEVGGVAAQGGRVRTPEPVAMAGAGPGRGRVVLRTPSAVSARVNVAAGRVAAAVLWVRTVNSSGWLLPRRAARRRR